MSSAPRYHFLSWVRDGLASAIEKAEDVGSPAGPASSGLASTVALNGQPVPVPDLTMIGPGEVTGFDRAQIVRMFPQPGVTDAEPTMFPLVEFDRPDLPWLATPRGAADDRLRPWLCLVVVEVGRPDVGFETRAGVDVEVLLAPASELPDPATLYLWAHAQLLLESTQTVEAGLSGDPRRTVSRLVCPRLLRPFTAYRACVVPAFRATVSAILGDGPRDDLAPAWESGAPATLPVLASWRFSTGEAGGFEELVDRLRGRPLPAGVGQRPLDVSRNPGLRAAGPNAVTQVESALRAPDVVNREPWPTDAAQDHFRDELASRVTKGAVPAELSDEPVVQPPLYGGLPWHLTSVDPDPASQLWADQLNADPRERVAAGLGTTVLQREQEALMERAWRQLADHQRAEAERRRALFARTVGESLFRRHLEPVADERAFALTVPVHGRVEAADAGVTVAGAVRDSRLPNATDGMPFRRALRPRGEIAARVARIAGAAEPFAGRLATIATTGLAVPYRTPDGILSLLEDPRDLFVDEARAAVVQVFADHGVEDLELLSSSIGANAALAAMSGEELAALGVPADFGADLEVSQVPELANARLRVQEGGLAEQLVTAGFALKLADGKVFAAPKDDAGLFLPVGIEREGIRVLTQAVHDEHPHQIPFTLAHPGHAIDVMLEPQHAVAITGLQFSHAAVAVHALAHEPIEDVHVAQAAAPWRGVAAESIGELSLSAELVAQASPVNATGVRQALLDWGRDEEVALVAAPGAKLEAFSSMVDLSPAAVADGLFTGISGMAQLPHPDPPAVPAFDLAANVAAARAAVQPATAVGRYLRQRLGTDPSLVLEPPMWTPTFPDAMWKALSAISTEWILAGLGRIPPNTVTLAETNDRFVEAYLVGLNHEIGREMVWREFPTDRRGTCFRSFWGVAMPQPGQPPRQVPEIEQLAAIAWRDGPLGAHKPAAAGVDAQLVLMIRGDLLRRYPGTIVFAVPDEDGHADFGSSRVKQPIFGGALGDEYRFLGFDLDADTARSEKWWFVFAEQPTEPRFGLDTSDGDWGPAQAYAAPALPAETPQEVLEAAAWNNANWKNAVPFDRFAPGIHAPAQADQLRLEGQPPLDPAVWGTHAADVARIAFQQPVRASVSAVEMLPTEPPAEPVLELLQSLRRQQLLPFRGIDA